MTKPKKSSACSNCEFLQQRITLLEAANLTILNLVMALDETIKGEGKESYRKTSLEVDDAMKLITKFVIQLVREMQKDLHLSHPKK
jgi:hypothetical protein